eukprot:3535669-Karenia_brevis.AAC.1
MQNQGVEVTPDLEKMITDRYIWIRNATTILSDPSMRLFWDWHVHRFIGRRNWLINEAQQQISSLHAEYAEAEVDRGGPLSQPVRAKPIPKA